MTAQQLGEGGGGGYPLRYLRIFSTDL